MSIWTTTHLECDGCQTEYDAMEHYAADVRAHAKKDGWFVGAAGGRDFCPDCRPDAERAS